MNEGWSLDSLRSLRTVSERISTVSHLTSVRLLRNGSWSDWPLESVDVVPQIVL